MRVWKGRDGMLRPQEVELELALGESLPEGHHVTEALAWDCIFRNAMAGLRLVAGEVERARERLRQAERAAADAAIEIRDVLAGLREFEGRK